LTQENDVKRDIEMKRLFLVLFFTVTIASQVNAQSTLLLQEKCAEVVKKSLGEGGISRDSNGDMTSVGYTNHYNKKLDKCFVLISSTIFTHTAKGQDQTQFSQNVFNAIEQKEIGSYYSNMVKEGSSWKNHVNSCKVGDTICHSKTEFEALIKPYMEE
jgi:hypothetical protein